MDSQQVTIPFEYFKELLSKAQQRDTLAAVMISGEWISREEIAQALGILLESENNEEEN